MRILTPTIIANNESQPSTAGALLRIHDQDATSGESLLIVSSDDSDYYFKVASNGRVHFRGNSTDGDGQIKVHLQHSGFTGAASSLIWDSSAGTNQMSIRQSEENSDLFVYAHAQSLNLAEFARTTADVTFNAQVTVNGQGSDILDLYDNAGTPANVLKVQNSGGLQLNKYGSATFTGTAAYTLAVDSSGNVIEITPTDANTTYDLASTQSGTDVDITLTGSDATTDTVTLVAGDAIVLTDDGSNNVTIATDGTSESTHIPVKNTSGSTITKGTPVYITGNVGSSDRLQIAAADASNLAKMPAIGLLETDLINNAEGFVVQGGYLRNITTDVIDGTSTSSNQTVYVKAGGGITMTKPTGSTNYIQNIAKVARVGSANSGSFIVSSILRTNDIPNLADGQVWVGSTTYPVSTDFNLQEVTDGGNTTTNDIVLSNAKYFRSNTSSGGNVRMLGINAGNIAYVGAIDSGAVGTIFNASSTSNYAAFYQGGSEKMRIHTNGSIGIGTSSPSAKLTISTDSVPHPVKIINTIAGGDFLVMEGDAGDNVFEFDSGGTGGEALQLMYKDGTLTNRISVNGDSYFNGGNIGIGTSSPSAQLHIKNTSGTNGLLIQRGSDNTTPTYQIVTDSTKNIIKANGEITYRVAALGGTPTEKMRIDTSGNVGIGTTSPSAFLEIANPTYSNATVLLGRQSGYPTIQGNGTSGGQWLMLDSNGGYLALNNHVTDNVILAWGGGDVAVGTGSPLARFHVKGSGNTSATTALLVENSSGTDTFKVLNDGQAQLGSYGSGTFTGTVSKILAVESGGNIIETTLSDLSGVAGSGTANYLPKWSTSDTLTDSLAYDDGGGQFVFEGSFFTGQSVATDSTNKSIRLATKHYTNAEEPFVGLLATSTSTANIVEIGGGTSLGNAATTVSFRTASNNTTVTGTERMRINSSGNVGVATTVPSYRFSVSGSMGTTNSGSVYIGGATGDTVIGRLGNTSGVLNLEGDGTRSIRLGSATNGEVVRVDNTNERLGIGTTSPSAKTHIVGAGDTTSTTALLVESNNGTDRLRVTDGSEVFVNASTLHYGADVASTTLGYKEFLTDVDYGTLNTGAISVYTSESTRDTIMCDYKIYDGTNIRVGTVTATTDGTSVDYTDIRKAEVGDTSDMYFYAQLSGSNLQLIFYRGSAGYDAKYIIKNF